jgi:hypothetical protein
VACGRIPEDKQKIIEIKNYFKSLIIIIGFGCERKGNGKIDRKFLSHASF